MPQHVFTIFIGFLSAMNIFKLDLNLKALEEAKVFPYVPSLSSARNYRLLTELLTFNSK